MEDSNSKNPVVVTIDGTEIRETNWITIKYNANEYARLIRISKLTGISPSKIIALSSQACPVCGNDHVALTIPLNLLSAKKQFSVKTRNKDDKQG